MKTKQPAGFAMEIELTPYRLRGQQSALPGRLLKFRLRRNNFVRFPVRHAVPFQRFAEGAASFLSGSFQIAAARFLATGKPPEQPAGLAMEIELTPHRLRDQQSALPGRLLKFRLWRNNLKGSPVRHAVPLQRFAEGAASFFSGLLQISAARLFSTGKPLC